MLAIIFPLMVIACESKDKEFDKDVDHISVTGTGETEKPSTVYERCDAPE